MALLIKNASLLGVAPELKVPARVDLFISGEKISAIGNFAEKKADEVFDAGGAFLAPGFIDVNTDSDHYLSLFDNPSQEDFLRQGVTTIVGGNCGSSLAPLLYGSLESIQKWTDVSNVNVDWHTVNEFLSLLERKPLGVNFVTLIGHSTVRRALVGDAIRNLTQSELVVMAETVRRGLSEGAAGLSTGLGYVHSRETPYEEIAALVKVVKHHDAVYSTHLRKGGRELGEAVREAVSIAEECGARVLVSHLLPLQGAEHEYQETLEMIEALPKEIDLHFDLYPFDTVVLPLYTFLPLWAQNGGRDVMAANVRDKWLQPRLVKDMPHVDPVSVKIAWAAKNDALRGMTLKDFMQTYDLVDGREALLRLMLTTELKAALFWRNINRSLVREGLKSKRSFVASNASSLAPERKEEKIDRATATFPTFLRMVQSERLMPLEDAVCKITREPARTLNLRGRGEIKEGNVADLTCFAGSEILMTVVGGRVAWKDGSFQGVFAGKPIRHKNY
jgi:N-acyl-D-amino-acid deacylase